MKKIIIPIIIFLIISCGQFKRIGAGLSGYSEYCIDGVEYIQFASGATVKYNQDGSVCTCK